MVLLKEPIYLKKSITDHVVDISVQDVPLNNNPWSLKERYLGNQNYRAIYGQHRYIQEAILIETGSVQISHNLIRKILLSHIPNVMW